MIWPFKKQPQPKKKMVPDLDPYEITVSANENEVAIQILNYKTRRGTWASIKPSDARKLIELIQNTLYEIAASKEDT